MEELAASVSRFRFPPFLGVGAGNGFGKRVPRVFAVDSRPRSFFARAGETVSASRGTFDASFADQRLESGCDGCRPGRGAFADLALRERRFGIRERLDDALFGGFGLRRGLGRPCPAEAQGQPLAVIGEFDLDVVEAGGGAMLDGHDDLAVAAAQVEVAVAPGVGQGIQLHI